MTLLKVKTRGTRDAYSYSTGGFVRHELNVNNFGIYKTCPAGTIPNKSTFSPVSRLCLHDIQVHSMYFDDFLEYQNSTGFLSNSLMKMNMYLIINVLLVHQGLIMPLVMMQVK